MWPMNIDRVSVLPTDTEEGAKFYERLGYARSSIDHAGHVKFISRQGIMNDGK